MTDPAPTSRQIRRRFVDYFVDKHAHVNVPSSPVVPHDDLTLLFANAGMNQFKPYFLGTQTPDHTRVANTQKCIRAGGKHNDLEDVGKDTYHHTFFEMLGNWSFGDYFKAQAIEWAWDLLVNVWGLDPRRLHATYFEGDREEGLEPDDEARGLWRRYLPDERIHPGNKKDNFWEMGDTGPCGPCSEIHYDGTPDLTGGGKVNADDPDVIEIWNLVFIQFNRNTDGSLTPLPAKHVDTGMGFERIVRVLQGKDSNYDTDVFEPIFAAIQSVTGARAYRPGGDAEALADPINVAYRVIADHIRTLTFALTDGAHCGNDGRSYVLRSILRRAVRYGRQTLGVDGPFFYKLVPAVVENFKDPFPELEGRQAEVAAEIREEEESFGKTLDRGIALFDEAAQGLSAGGSISGEDAFKLHDTYGFPISLTKLMAEERGLAVDEKNFEQCMARAREISKAGQGGGDWRDSLTEIVQQQDLPDTEFVGYDQTERPAEAMRMFVFKLEKDAYIPVDLAEQGDQVAVVVDKTPFYAEAGGQVGDAGAIQVNCGGRVDVVDTIKVGDVYFHLGAVVAGPLAKADAAPTALAVDRQRRRLIMSNHTTTHVMNRALRSQVNPEADQKGSLVDDEKLRFDFSHGKAVTDDQLAAVEKQVNDDIAADLPVYTGFAPQEDALKINGLRAVFGEKYPPSVRVVSIGARVEDLLADPGNADWAGLSIEFCGGTHLPATGEAEGFVIISEEAVGKGVRRLTALTGAVAHRASAEADGILHRLRQLQDAPAEGLAKAVEQVTQAINEATLPLLQKREAQALVAGLNQRIKDHQKAQGGKAQEAAVEMARRLADEVDGEMIVARLDGVDGKALLPVMDVVRKRHPDAAILLGAANEEKVAFAAAVPKDKIAAGLKAGDWVKQAAAVCGGGGGGRPDMAQAGGKDPSKLDAALDAARDFAAAQTT